MIRFAVLALVLAGCKRGPSEAAAQASKTADATYEPSTPGEPRALDAIAPAAVCPTKGSDAGRITEPVVRAVAPGTTGDAAALRFTYRGFTKEEVALGSGQIRRQLGLKLRAADGCNLVYVMWRIDPGPGIEVSIKHNPGKHTHAACGTGGYTKLKSAVKAKAPKLEPNVEHVLHAEIAGDELIAWVDGAVVWQGPLPATARELAGPAGLRTDNVVVDAELRATGTPTGVCDAALTGD